jgi:hypothetical protein
VVSDKDRSTEGVDLSECGRLGFVLHGFNLIINLG